MNAKNIVKLAAGIVLVICASLFMFCSGYSHSFIAILGLAAIPFSQVPGEISKTAHATDNLSVGAIAESSPGATAISVGCSVIKNPFTIPEVQNYSSVLDKVLHSNDPQSIEPVFAQAQAAALKLQPLIESLDQPTFNKLEKNLKGLVLIRVEIIAVEPDLKFFSDLVELKGLKADKAFFSLYNKTKYGVWPVYIQQQTDFTGCVKYGKKIMVSLFVDWNRFREEFGGAYNTQAEGAINKISSELTTGICACGDEESVLSEFEAFIKAFPKSAVSEVLTNRIKAINAGTSDIRFDCISR